MSRSLFVIILVVALDAVGIGLIFPILPSLLKELTGSGQVSTTYGIIVAAYAAMQFIFAPILGLISDRVGRRPVLIVSLAGAAIDYLIMALSPLSAIGAVGLPALQSLMSAQVGEDRQGELQGVLASAQSLTSIVGPLIGTTIFSLTVPGFPGAVWLVAAALYLLAIPVLPRVFRQGRAQTAAG
jgi:DHA1 family tetracycline resistance protein-like MFS transporter